MIDDPGNSESAYCWDHSWQLRRELQHHLQQHLETIPVVRCRVLLIHWIHDTTRKLFLCKLGEFPSWSGISTAIIRIFLSVSVIIGVVASLRTTPQNTTKTMPCFAVNGGPNLIRNFLHAWKPPSSRTARWSPSSSVHSDVVLKQVSELRDPCSSPVPSDFLLRATDVLKQLLAWGMAVHVLLCLL